MTRRPPGPAHRRQDTRPLEPGIIEHALRRSEAPHPADGATSVSSPPTGARWRRSQVLVLDVDSELADAMPPAALTRARAALRATAFEHGPGPLTLPSTGLGTFALMIVAGAL